MSDTTDKTADDHYFEALDLFAQGRHDEAIAAYQRSLSADPRHTEAMHGLARVYQDTQQYDRAIEVARRIADLDPDDVLAHTSLSILYQKKGMIPEAEEEANRARILGWKQQLREKKQ